jgi:hypothetical protein
MVEKKILMIRSIGDKSVGPSPLGVDRHQFT